MPVPVRGGDRPGEQRVLRVALLVAPPARVAQQVDHRRPEVEPEDVRVARRGSRGPRCRPRRRPARSGRCPRCWRAPPAAGTRCRRRAPRAPLLSTSLDQATPCSASVPALNRLMPSRGMAGWYWWSREIFSSRVSRPRPGRRREPGAAGVDHGTGTRGPRAQRREWSVRPVMRRPAQPANAVAWAILLIEGWHSGNGELPAQRGAMRSRPGYEGIVEALRLSAVRPP